MIEVFYSCDCCKHALKSRVRYRGSKASCPACGTFLVVPITGGLISHPVSLSPEEFPSLPPYPYYAKEENGNADQFVRGMLAFAGAFLMGVGIGAIVTVALMGGRG